jgi:hypothetical protein
LQYLRFGKTPLVKWTYLWLVQAQEAWYAVSGKYLKMKKLGVKIIYVEPAESPIISGTTPFQNLDLLENKLLEVMKSSFSCLKVSMYTLATQV